MGDRAIAIFPEPPYPIRGGGAMRSAAILHYLAQHYSLDVILFAEQGRPDPRAALPSGTVNRAEVIWLPKHSPSFPARLARNSVRLIRGVPPLVDRFSGFADQVEQAAGSDTFDVALYEHFWCAGYRDAIHARRHVLDLHNVESSWHSAQGAIEHGRAHNRFAKICRQLESGQLPRFDLVLTTSASDAGELPQGVNAAVYPNTIPPREAPVVEQKHTVVFSGNFDYRPNQIGLSWFLESVWPLVREHDPAVSLVLAGKGDQSAARLARGQRGIRLTGEIEDTISEIASAKVALVPVRSGSGTRVKIVEAWCAGTPVVSTTVGAAGLPRRAMLLADEPAEFARALLRLLAEPQLGEQMRGEGRQIFERGYTWQAGWRILGQIGL